MADLEERIANIERALNHINHELGKLVGQQRTTVLLVKYVVLPLLIILGGLVGIKIVLPVE
jgi:hypothetical protein